MQPIDPYPLASPLASLITLGVLSAIVVSAWFWAGSNKQRKGWSVVIVSSAIVAAMLVNLFLLLGNTMERQNRAVAELNRVYGLTQEESRRVIATDGGDSGLLSLGEPSLDFQSYGSTELAWEDDGDVKTVTVLVVWQDGEFRLLREDLPTELVELERVG